MLPVKYVPLETIIMCHAIPVVYTLLAPMAQLLVDKVLRIACCCSYQQQRGYIVVSIPRTKRTRVTEYTFVYRYIVCILQLCIQYCISTVSTDQETRVRNLMGMMTGGTFKGRMERGESEPKQNIVILPKIFPTSTVIQLYIIYSYILQ